MVINVGCTHTLTKSHGRSWKRKFPIKPAGRDNDLKIVSLPRQPNICRTEVSF